MIRWQSLDDGYRAGDIARLDATPGGLWNAVWADRGVPRVLATCRTLAGVEALIKPLNDPDAPPPSSAPPSRNPA